MRTICLYFIQTNLSNTDRHRCEPVNCTNPSTLSAKSANVSTRSVQSLFNRWEYKES